MKNRSAGSPSWTTTEDARNCRWAAAERIAWSASFGSPDRNRGRSPEGRLATRFPGQSLQPQFTQSFVMAPRAVTLIRYVALPTGIGEIIAGSGIRRFCRVASRRKTRRPFTTSLFSDVSLRSGEHLGSTLRVAVVSPPDGDMPSPDRAQMLTRKFPIGHNPTVTIRDLPIGLILDNCKVNPPTESVGIRVILANIVPNQRHNTHRWREA